jgi:hypothetical protein
MPVTIDYWAELMVEVEGSCWQGPEPDVGIFRGSFEDIDIVGLKKEVRKYDPTAKVCHTVKVDLLAGVDLKSKDVQRLLTNLMSTLDMDDIQAELASEMD